MWSVIHVPFAESRLWMLAYGVRRKVRRKFTVDKTAWSFGASAITRSIIAACHFGSNKTIVVHCASKNGLSNEWGNNRNFLSQPRHFTHLGLVIWQVIKMVLRIGPF